MPKCITENCDRPVRGRGLCGTHYAFRRRHGTLPPLPPPTLGCSVPECVGVHEAKGLCKLHYQRWRQTGSTETPICRLPDSDRFWVKVDRQTDDSCWPWLGGISTTGYGHTWRDGKTHLAHRIAYELAVGPVPVDLTLDHLCRNRWCVNPAHLEPTTQRINNIRSDGPSGRNARLTHCLRGHEFTPANTYRPPQRPNSRMCRRCMAIRSAAARKVHRTREG